MAVVGDASSRQIADSGHTKGPNRWLAAGLSAVIPGLGHIYLRQYRRAVIWIAPLFILTAVLALTFDVSVVGIVNAAIDPAVLWRIFWVNAAVGLWRIAAAVDAYLSTGRANAASGPTVLAVGWAVLAMFVIAPHVLVGSYTIDAVRLSEILLVADDAIPSQVPVIPIGTDADLVPDPAIEALASVMQFPSQFNENVWDPDARAARITIEGNRHTAEPAPFLPFNERVGEKRVTILIAGGDAGPGRGGLRTDSMIVASLNTGTGKAALFGFPRNLGSIPLPKKFDTAFVERELLVFPPPEPVEGEPVVEWESCACFPEQMNAIYPFTRKWTSTYPSEVDPGMAALRDVIEGLMGVNIDYYMLVDMAAFVDLVDAIGGVDVYVRQPLKSEVSPPREGDPWAKVDVDVGWNHLSGPEALAYSRARKGSSDYARMERQRCMLRGVAAKANPVTLLRSFPAIVDALSNSVVTNIPRSFVAEFIAAAGNLDFSDIETVGFTHAYWLDERDASSNPIPDVDRIRSKVRRVLSGQDEAATADVSSSECN